MRHKTEERQTGFLAGFGIGIVVGGCATGEQAVFMLFGISRKSCTFGPIQTIFPLATPRVAIFLEAGDRGLKILWQQTGCNNLATNRLDEVEDTDTAGTMLNATVAGNTVPGSTRRGLKSATSPPAQTAEQVPHCMQLWKVSPTSWRMMADFASDAFCAFSFIEHRKIASGRYIRCESLPKGSIRTSMPTQIPTWIT